MNLACCIGIPWFAPRRVKCLWDSQPAENFCSCGVHRLGEKESVEKQATLSSSSLCWSHNDSLAYLSYWTSTFSLWCSWFQNTWGANSYAANTRREWISFSGMPATHPSRPDLLQAELADLFSDKCLSKIWWEFLQPKFGHCYYPYLCSNFVMGKFFVTFFSL